MATADLTRLASRLYAAVLAVRGELDDPFRSALFASDGAASGAWGLALVLASWRRQRAGDSLSELTDTGVGALVSQIQSFENAFPSSFSKFLDAAEKATDAGRIAAAGSYFATTVRELGFVVRPSLLAWLNSSGFLKVATSLRNKLGGPENAAQTVSLVPPVNRTRSFDEADFPPARRSVQSPSAVQVQPPPPPIAPSMQIAASPVPIQVELPKPSQRDVQLAALVAVGWSPEEAAQLLAGPKGKPQNPESTPTPAPQQPRPPVIDGKTILDRAKDKEAPKPRAPTSDVGAITGVVKSGLDVLGEILKQVNAGGSKGSGGGQKEGSNGGGGSMSPFGGGGMNPFGGGDLTMSDDTPTRDFEPEAPESMPTYGGPSFEGGGSSGFDINDSSEVID